MNPQPTHWLDRMVEACVCVLFAAMALYGAVKLVALVWLPLCIGLAVAGTVGTVAWLISRRRQW